MVNIVAPDGITIDLQTQIIQKHKCKKCNSQKLRPIVFVKGKNNSAFCYECINCYEHDFFIYTRKPLSTSDLIVNIVENVGDLNKQIQEEPSQGICSKCNKGRNHSIDVSKCNRMALDIIKCDNCHFTVPIISIVRNTLIAYSHDIQLGKRVAKEFPEIAIVFCVSGLETYFRQLFQYHSELNEFLVKERRVNFQSLNEIKIICKKEFGIDVVKLIEKDWTFLYEKFKMRHIIIHHASVDEKGRKIELPEEEINKLFSIVDDLVYKVEIELFNNDIVI